MGSGTAAGIDADHECFGCRKQIGDGAPHIHVGLDEWSGQQGLATFGLDDLFTMAFCETCTTESRKGWHLESHPIERSAP